MKRIKIILIVFVLILSATSVGAFVVDKAEYGKLSPELASMSIGDRIAFWAEQFVGNPYDTDPLGEYVRRAVIEADERVDCMYLTFRAAELAFSSTYSQAVGNALDLRFATKGKVNAEGKVLNYDERYQYAMDMIRSGKWGRDVTASLGPVREIPGDRGVESVQVLERKSIVSGTEGFRNGDIIFFVKDPKKRVVGEIIGHIGIVVVSKEGTFVVHASGVKKKGGVVKKVVLSDYAEQMPFIGVVVTRFD